jgi:predicted amidohydrolase
MRVAAVQFKPDKDDLSGSRERLVSLAMAAGADADLVVLPEMAVSGYVFATKADVAAVAERPDGPTYQALSAVGPATGAWVVAGFPERADGHLYNSAMVIDPTGALVFVYRKTMLYDADLIWASPGDSGYRRFETPSGTFGVGICMDLNDPRFVMWCWRSRLDAIAFPTNWVDEGVDVWPYWQGRIGGSGAALVAANTYGLDGGVMFSGRSAILRGDDVLASAEISGDAVIRAKV